MGRSRGRYSLPYQDRKQLEDLFKRLDVDKDGEICSLDLERAIDEHHGNNCHYSSSSIAENFLKRCGVEAGGHLRFPDFVEYVLEHDKRLVLAFDHLDQSNNGCITVEDIQTTFEKFGMPLDGVEASRLLRRVDQAGNLNIDYGEWREFLLFHPAADIAGIFKYWRHDSCMDVGCDASVLIPEDFLISEKKSGKQLLQLTAGAIAGAVSRAFTAPIDRVKLMRQVYGYKHKTSSYLQTYRYMLQEGGITSLWRGNGLNMLKIAPETAIKYGSYEHYKRFLITHDHPLIEMMDENRLLTKFLAGSMAGSTAQTIIYPFEVVRTRMCLRKTGQYPSIWHCVRSVYEQQGLLTFYRGYFVNLLGIVPYAGIELAMYEICKTAYVRRFMQPMPINSTDERPPTQLPPTYIIPVLAAFSSACGITVTYPFSLVRAKLQANYWSHTTNRKVTSTGLLRDILREDGPRGLYRGIMANLFKVLPAVGISYVTYEALLREFHLNPMGSG